MPSVLRKTSPQLAQCRSVNCPWHLGQSTTGKGKSCPTTSAPAAGIQSYGTCHARTQDASERPPSQPGRRHSPTVVARRLCIRGVSRQRCPRRDLRPDRIPGWTTRRNHHNSVLCKGEPVLLGVALQVGEDLFGNKSVTSRAGMAVDLEEKLRPGLGMFAEGGQEIQVLDAMRL
jgi:hypothetical protein